MYLISILWKELEGIIIILGNHLRKMKNIWTHILSKHMKNKHPKLSYTFVLVMPYPELSLKTHQNLVKNLYFSERSFSYPSVVCRNSFDINDCLSQPGLIKMRASVHFLARLFSRFTAHFQRYWVALKHRFNTWTLARFYYVHIDTYCCVFNKLLQQHIAAVQNSNIQGPLLKMYVLSSCKYALHQIQP